MKILTEKLANEFTDAEYAHAYMESHAVSRLAAQVFALRKQRGWSQEELAQRAGIAQERISKIESGNFDSLTMKTLRNFSHAFDVNLHISFEPFSEGILDVVNIKPSQLQVKSREEDLASLSKKFVTINSNGNWFAMDKTQAQSVVRTVAPKTFILNEAKFNEWQNLKAA
jgi:transcriptional regulator with XRE-family HTH domain